MYEDLLIYADGYAHVAEGFSYEDGWESEEDEDSYYENCFYGWVEITKEEYNEFLGIED